MPSPVKKNKRAPSGYYRRKGGAYDKRPNGTLLHVGSGNGHYSRRNLSSDRKRKATVNRRKASRYPQAYDFVPVKIKRTRKRKVRKTSKKTSTRRRPVKRTTRRKSTKRTTRRKSTKRSTRRNTLHQDVMFFHRR